MIATEYHIRSITAVPPGLFAQYTITNPGDMKVRDGVSTYRYGFLPIVAMAVVDGVNPDFPTERHIEPMVAGFDGMIERASEAYKGYCFTEFFCFIDGAFSGLQKHPDSNSAFWVRGVDQYRVDA